jgi:hypothetical protein
MEIFLDMDGVLADLFEKVAQEIHYKSYLDLTIGEKEEARRIWKDSKESNLFFNRQGGVECFFANLPTFGEKTNTIIKTVLNFTPSYCICSKPASINPQASKDGKLKWIKQHLTPSPIKAVFPHNKAKYALNSKNEPNILIDDFPPYIESWKQAGGIAIEMRTDKFNDSNQLQAFLTEQLNKIFNK